MKKIVSLIPLLLLFFFNSNAQKKWGLTAGAGVSKISGYNFADTKADLLLVLHSSVFTQIPLGKKDMLVFKPSIGYSPRGAKLSNVDSTGNDIGTDNIKRRLDYIQLSLPVCFKMKSKNNVVTLIGAGPYAAYAVSGRQLIDNRLGQLFGNIDKTSVPVDFTKVNRFDAGITLQCAILFSDGWCTGLNADIGLTKVNSSGRFNNSHNSYAGIYFGYIF